MIEMLIVIAVIGVMSALVISAFSGAAQDTRKVIARQQQAAVQNAVNAWVNKKSSEVGVGLLGARTIYNAQTTAKAKLILIGGDYDVSDGTSTIVSGFLDESTMSHFIKNTSDSDKIQSQALKKTDQYLSLADWNAASYPKVELK